MRTVLNTVSTLAVAVVAAASFTAAPAKAERYTEYAFGKTGNWTVNRVMEGEEFNHCRAGTSYESGTEIYFMATGKAWLVQFHHAKWPQRAENTPFEARLEVDGRPVSAVKAFWSGNSAFFVMGQDMASVAPLMRGNVLSVISGQGTSSFRLNGSSAAAKLTSKCAVAAMSAQPKPRQAPVTSHDAFGGPTASAEPAAPPVERRQPVANAQPRKLGHGETLGAAREYLQAAGVEAEIVAEKDNVLKHFPVNWKTSSGVNGGMMVLKNYQTDARRVMDNLFEEQGKLCAEGSGKGNRQQVAREGKTPVEITMYACQRGSNLTTTILRTVDVDAETVIVVIEMITKSTEPATALGQPRSSDA